MRTPETNPTKLPLPSGPTALERRFATIEKPARPIDPVKAASKPAKPRVEVEAQSPVAEPEAVPAPRVARAKRVLAKAEAKAGRPRKHASAAERQKAYLARKHEPNSQNP